MNQRVSDIIALGRPNRTTDRARLAMQNAIDAADGFGDSCIDSCHLLYGLYLEGSGVAANVLNHLELSKSGLHEHLANRDRVCCESPLALDDDISVVMTEALASADRMNHSYIGTEHLLCGIVANGTKSVKLLSDFGIAADAVTHEVLGLMGWLS